MLDNGTQLILDKLLQKHTHLAKKFNLELGSGPIELNDAYQSGVDIGIRRGLFIAIDEILKLERNNEREVAKSISDVYSSPLQASDLEGKDFSFTFKEEKLDKWGYDDSDYWNITHSNCHDRHAQQI